ncbi:hypothetical protein ACFL3G_02095 [Planctomycetota bacterium]
METVEIRELVSDDRIKKLGELACDIATNYPKSYFYNGVELIFIVDESITRHCLGGEPQTQEELNILRRQHLETALICTETAMRLQQIYEPDIVLGQMYVYSIGGPFYRYFEKIDSCKQITLNLTGHNYKAFLINESDTYFSNDRFHNYARTREKKLLNEEEKNELQKWLDERFKCNHDFHKIHNCFDDEGNLAKKLNINIKKHNIFLFSNLFWDAGLNKTGSLFANTIDWVLSTIDLIKNDPNCVLYIKPHFVEKFGNPSAKGLLDYVYEQYPVLPENIIPIPPEMKVHTYKLFPYIDIGIVFNSTLGVELLSQDIPVAVVGKSQYSGLNFCYEPSTVEEYKQILKNVNCDTIHDKDNFELFCYYYFIKRCIPFNITDTVHSNANFEKYNIDSLDDLLPGKNYYLDHLCDCIMKDKIPESW